MGARRKVGPGQPRGPSWGEEGRRSGGATDPPVRSVRRGGFAGRVPGGLVLVAVLLLAAVPHAQAQRPIDVERFRPPLDPHGFVSMQGTRMPGHLRWNSALWLSWSRSPLVLDIPAGDDEREVDIIERRLTADLVLQLGLGERFALAVDLPFVPWQQGHEEALRDDAGEIPVAAVGDPRVYARARLVGEGTASRRQRAEGFGLGLLAGVTLPVGTDDAFVAEAGTTTDLRLTADFHLLGAGAAVMLGWRHRFEPATFGSVRFRDQLLYGIGVKVPLPITDGLAVLTELRGATDAGSPFGDTPRTPLEAGLGAVLERGELAFTGAFSLGLTGGTGAPRVRGILAVAWSPLEKDADGDGIPDDRDECPHLPEDFDGFEDEDGCLDPDNDNDLVPDVDDRCPDESADPYRDEDQDGCSDPVRDGDGDGIEDVEDACPNEPEDADGFEDEDGCAEPDNDGDGIADADDACPDEAEDLDGYEDEDGCPEPDNDGDDIADADDACPDEAEDADGFEDEDGCPDPDNDRDGVADADDRCAEEQEDIDGREDSDGCPEAGGRSLWSVERGPATGRPERSGDFRLSGRVAFGAQGSVAGPHLRTGGSIDQLARHLLAGWGRSWRVRVATDSEARHGALRSVLEERGVPGPRFEVTADPALRGAAARVEPSEPTDSASRASAGGGPSSPEQPPADAGKSVE